MLVALQVATLAASDVHIFMFVSSTFASNSSSNHTLPAASSPCPPHFRGTLAIQEPTFKLGHKNEEA
jgi:hypothetical protein